MPGIILERQRCFNPDPIHQHAQRPSLAWRVAVRLRLRVAVTVSVRVRVRVTFRGLEFRAEGGGLAQDRVAHLDRR